MRQTWAVYSLALMCGLVSAGVVGAQPAIVHLPGGGIVPCDHPLAIQAGLGCGSPGVVTTALPAPPPVLSAPTPSTPFLLGHTYVRSATSGERISIAAVGTLQLPAPFGPAYVLFAQCLNTLGICAPLPDGSSRILTLPINTNRADFADEGVQ